MKNDDGNLMINPHLYPFVDDYRQVTKSFENMESRLYTILVNPKEIDGERKIELIKHLRRAKFDTHTFYINYRMVITNLTKEEIKDISKIIGCTKLEIEDQATSLDEFMFPLNHLPPL